MAHDVKLSDHCLVNHFVDSKADLPVAGAHMRLVKPFNWIDRKMHFTGLRGGIWRLLGVDRSHKNPNICNI